jgi:hypothetical protein
MDKDFWYGIIKNEYAVPAGHSVEDLTAELLACLGSTDPELRDDIAYMVLANWINNDAVTAGQLRKMIRPLQNNLESGLGESGTDTVFLRTFSALILGEIVDKDNNTPFLEKEQVSDIFEKSLAYLARERDLRGFVPEKGWAHALAHTADLLRALARSNHIDSLHLDRILNAISSKLMSVDDLIFVADEDERLVSTVIEILNRKILDLERLNRWLDILANKEGGGHRPKFFTEHTARTRQKLKTFVRSLHYRLVMSETPAPLATELIPRLRETSKAFTPWV